MTDVTKHLLEGPLTATEVSKASGLTYDQARTELQKLARRGVVFLNESSSPKRYQLCAVHNNSEAMKLVRSRWSQSGFHLSSNRAFPYMGGL